MNHEHNKHTITPNHLVQLKLSTILTHFEHGNINMFIYPFNKLSSQINYKNNKNANGNDNLFKNVYGCPQKNERPMKINGVDGDSLCLIDCL